MKNKLNIKETVIIFIAFAILATGFCYVCSLCTSPLFKYYVGSDTGIFLTIQKCWAKGVLPYQSLFDHKGPFSFFIGMLGFLFNNDSTIGLFMLQIIFMVAFLFSCYAIAQLEIKNKKICFGITVATLAVLSLIYCGGNMVAEYTLPFLGFTMYGLMKYFIQTEEHPENVQLNPLWAFFYGITFATCFLTRLTNSIPIGCGILVILFLIIKNQEWKNLMFNAIAFILGFLTLFSPFAIYFASHGVFHEFWYGTIGFNFDLVGATTPWILNNLSVHNIWLYFTRYFPVHGTFLAAIIAYSKKKNPRAVFYLLVTLIETWMFLRTKLFFHYAMIAMPQFVIIFAEVINMDCKKLPKVTKKILLCLLVVYSLFSIKSYAKSFGDTYNETLTYTNEYDELMQLIPKEEKNSFIAYQVDKYIYYHYDIIPYYKFFILQENHSGYSKKTAEAIYKTFSEGDCKWILTGDKITRIEDVLRSRYELVAQTDNKKYSLYHLSK